MAPRALISDFDNTLYDWAGFFVPAFYEMLNVAVDILGCDRDKLISEFRAIHRRHGDSEHPFSLLETGTVQSFFVDKSAEAVLAALDPAFHAFNRTRKQHLKAYDGVREGLTALLAAGIKIVGHTEARPLAVRDRLVRLELHQFFSRVYCRERARAHVDDDFGPWNGTTEIVELSHHQQKPSPSVLLEICAMEGLEPSEAVYVGDSLFKDVSMANAAGVPVAWAKYGSDVDSKAYEKLVAVSHWTDEDVLRAREFARGAKPARPNLVLDRRFDEILPMFGLAESVTRACG